MGQLFHRQGSGTCLTSGNCICLTTLEVNPRSFGFVAKRNSNLIPPSTLHVLLCQSETGDVWRLGALPKTELHSFWGEFWCYKLARAKTKWTKNVDMRCRWGCFGIDVCILLSDFRNFLSWKSRFLPGVTDLSGKICVFPENNTNVHRSIVLLCFYFCRPLT